MQRAPVHEPAAAGVELRFRVATRDDWTLSEATVPESRAHDLTVALLRDVLAYWARTARPTAQVGSNLAVRWDASRPKVGVDPDVYLVDPAPPEGDDVTSLRLWERGHHPPLLAVEVVSLGHPEKDYALAPAKCAACGIQELWIFDPLLVGPPALGGPHRLQVWTRDSTGTLVRGEAGEGPAYSPLLGAWLVATDDGTRVRIAADRDGRERWPTAEEAERAAKDAERAAKEAALARVAELEAALGSRR